MEARNRAQKNVKDFVAKYGVEGYLRLFITNYLFELTSYYLYSEQHGTKKDSTTLMFFDYKDDPYTRDQIDRFRSDLRSECSRKAEAIVSDLKRLGLSGTLAEEPLGNPELATRLSEALSSILKDVARRP
jgi:hypothetical protein